ncbi:SDR family NAD(P)-dependent oxidoreductase [Dactylosporangium sp. NPDC005572]|uniref:SDR family NAD(P)-dependent oxidoreductase n=1 Tax=Dactylosporangium sp. NPDC005572 TaxID=3156889 RepID=UPI0033B0F64E
MNVEGRVAVVVGGASGMARATAAAILARGGRVAILDLATSAGAEVARAFGNATTFHPCDVTDFAGTESALNDAVEAHGGLHIAVNTAGGGVAERTVKKDGPHALESFQQTIALNLVGTFNLNRLQAWHMSRNEADVEGERGVIIDTASIAGFEGQIGQVAYSASKAGIVGMMLTMARDLGSLGIRVAAIAPSLFATGLTAGIPPEREATLTAGSAFPRRMGRPDEYARLAIGIIENPMINGTTIRLDGGQRFAAR